MGELITVQRSLKQLSDRAFKIFSEMSRQQQREYFPINEGLNSSSFNDTRLYIKTIFSNEDLSDLEVNLILETVAEKFAMDVLLNILKNPNNVPTTPEQVNIDEKPSQRLNKKVSTGTLISLVTILGISSVGTVAKLIQDRFSGEKPIPPRITQVASSAVSTEEPTFTLSPTFTQTNPVTAIPTLESIVTAEASATLTSPPTEESTLKPSPTQTPTPEINQPTVTLTVTPTNTVTSTSTSTTVLTETDIPTTEPSASPTLTFTMQPSATNVIETQTPNPTSVAVSNSNEMHNFNQEIPLAWTTNSSGVPGLIVEKGDTHNDPMWSLHEERIVNYDDHLSPSPLVMQGFSTTIGDSSLSSRVVEIQGSEILRTVIPLRVLQEIAGDRNIPSIMNESTFRTLIEQNYPVTQEQFNILQVYFLMIDLNLSQSEADLILTKEVSELTEREKVILEIRERFTGVTGLGLMDIYRLDSHKYADAFLELILKPLGYDGIIAPKSPTDLGRTFYIEIFNPDTQQWVSTFKYADGQTRRLKVIALDSAKLYTWTAKRSDSLNNRFKPTNEPSPWLCDLSIEILSQIELQSYIGTPLEIRLTDTKIGNNNIRYPSDVPNESYFNEINLKPEEFSNGINSFIFKGKFHDKKARDEGDFINIAGRGPAYAIEYIEHADSSVTLSSSSNSKLYILAGVDFGVGGINYDPIYDSHGEIIGLAGDWTLSWDTGPREDDPTGPWRDITLFNPTDIVSGYLPDGHEYKIIKFNFSENPLGINFRELVILKDEGIWKFISMRAFGPTNNFVNEYVYNNEFNLNNLILSQSSQQATPTSVLTNTESSDTINFTYTLNDTFVHILDFDFDKDGLVDISSWVEEATDTREKIRRQTIVDSAKEVIDDLYPEFGFINQENYAQALIRLGKNPGEKINRTDIKNLILQKVAIKLDLNPEDLTSTSIPETVEEFMLKNLITAPANLIGKANVLYKVNNPDTPANRQFNSTNVSEAYEYLRSGFRLSESSESVSLGIDLNEDLGGFIYWPSVGENYSKLMKLTNADGSIESDEAYLSRIRVTNPFILEALLSKPSAITLFSNNANGVEGGISGLEELRRVSIVLKEINPNILIGIDFETPNLVDRIAGDPDPIYLNQKGSELKEIIRIHGENSPAYNTFLTNLQSEARESGEIIAFREGRGGVDMIYAPVVDLTNPPGGSESSGYYRNISDDPNITYAIALTFAQGMNEAGVKVIFKHAPLGTNGTELHAPGISYIDFTRESFQIWTSLNSAGLLQTNGVMITHAIVNPINPSDLSIPDQIVKGSNYNIPASVNPFMVDYFRANANVVLSDGVSMGSFRSWLKGSDSMGDVMKNSELKLAYLIHSIAGSTMLTDTTAGDQSQLELSTFLAATTQQFKAAGLNINILNADASPEERSDLILVLVKLYQENKLFDRDGRLNIQNVIDESLNLGVEVRNDGSDTIEITNAVIPVLYRIDDPNLSRNIPAKYNVFAINQIKLNNPNLSIAGNISDAAAVNSVFEPRPEFPDGSQYLRAALAMYLAGVDIIEFESIVPQDVLDEYNAIMDSISNLDLGEEFSDSELLEFINDPTESGFNAALTFEIEDLRTGENGVYDVTTFNRYKGDNFSLKKCIAAIGYLSRDQNAL